jgi:hypothetical protein
MRDDEPWPGGLCGLVCPSLARTGTSGQKLRMGAARAGRGRFRV